MEIYDEGLNSYIIKRMKSYGGHSRQWSLWKKRNGIRIEFGMKPKMIIIFTTPTTDGRGYSWTVWYKGGRK